MLRRSASAPESTAEFAALGAEAGVRAQVRQRLAELASQALQQSLGGFRDSDPERRGLEEGQRELRD